MIKSENESLRRSLDKRSRQLDRMHSEHMDCDAREVFNSPLSHLNLCFSVAICRNSWTLRKMYHLISICISIFSFIMFKMGFKWGMTFLLPKRK